MRGETDKAKLEQFLTALGRSVSGPGSVFLVGGGTAVLVGWRAMTIGVDLKASPEPAGFFEAIARLKNELDLNVEIAGPDDFIPEVPGWRDRSLFVARHGAVDFFHYDPVSQALAKIERGHTRDLQDVAAMLERKMVTGDQLWKSFQLIEPALIRFPAIDPATFRRGVLALCPGQGKARLKLMWDAAIEELPGADLIRRGLEDVAEGRLTVFACLVWMAKPVLERAGIFSEDFPHGAICLEPELTMYRLLKSEGGDSFGRYNALIRRLVSFQRALSRRR